MDFDSTDRKAADFILFGMGFCGFLLGATGVVIASTGAAVLGLVLLLFSIASFQLRP